MTSVQRLGDDRDMGRLRGVAPADLVLSLVAAVVILGPMLFSRGYVLRGDLVFVPDQPWKGAWLGLDGRVPRFVPGDAFLSGMGMLLPGDLVQKLVLVGALVLGGVGAGRLVARWSVLPRAGAITLFLWNPWVYERLAIGQWGVVVGYLFLPWTALAAERARDAVRGDWRSWCGMVVWLGLSAVFSPASGLVALATAAAMVLVGGGARRAAGTLAIGLFLNLPWILPSLLYAGSLVAAPGQFRGFAPRGESALGVVASVLSFGGIWKESVVPAERESAVIVVLSVLLTLCALLGMRVAVKVERRRVLGLGLVGAATLVLALATSIPAMGSLLDDASPRMPALGLLRDSQRFLGPVVLALVPGIAGATAWLQEKARHGREALHGVAVLLVVAPVLCLPSLAWGLGGDFRPVAYPQEWFRVRELLPEGRTVVLPWRGGYRGFAWNDRRASLDPAPRFFPGDVVIDDRLYLDDRTIDSEDPLLRAVGRALDSEDPAAGLRRLGVRTVLREKGNGEDSVTLSGARVLHDGLELTVTDLGRTGATTPWSGNHAATVAIVVVDLLVLVVWLSAGLVATLTTGLGRRPRGMRR